MEQQVVYLLDRNRSLVFSGMAFYVLSGCNRELVAKVPTSSIIRLLSGFGIASRFFRLQIRATAKLGDVFALSMLGGVWILNLKHKTIKMVFKSPISFSMPLNFCVFDDYVYWGDYGRNQGLVPVNIYRMDKNGDIEIIYSFRTGQIRHIHNIIFDDLEPGFWILCGDNENEAGIYRASVNFSNVKPFRIGLPIYRCVVAFSDKNGLLYATDSVESTNHIYLLKYSGELIDLGEINGTSIYGCENVDNYYFSTSVEPTEDIKGWRRWFTRKLGNGIKDRYVHLVCVPKNGYTTRILKRYKKDCLPLGLFQYGCIRFPGGQEDRTEVTFYPFACTKRGVECYSSNLEWLSKI